MKSPTVSSCSATGGYAVETVVAKSQINMLIPALKDAGASRHHRAADLEDRPLTWPRPARRRPPSTTHAGLRRGHRRRRDASYFVPLHRDRRRHAARSRWAPRCASRSSPAASAAGRPDLRPCRARTRARPQSGPGAALGLRAWSWTKARRIWARASRERRLVLAQAAAEPLDERGHGVDGQRGLGRGSAVGCDRWMAASSYRPMAWLATTWRRGTAASCGADLGHLGLHRPASASLASSSSVVEPGSSPASARRSAVARRSAARRRGARRRVSKGCSRWVP